MPKTLKRRRSKLGAAIARARATHDPQHGRAHCANLIGVAPTTVTNWEEHGKRPLKAHVPAIAKYLGLSVSVVERLRGSAR